MVIEIAPQRRNQAHGDGDVQRLTGLGLAGVEPQPEAVAAGQQMPAHLHAEEVTLAQRPHRQKRDHEAVPVAERGLQRRVRGDRLGALHQLHSQAQQIVGGDDASPLIAARHRPPLQPRLQAAKPGPILAGRQRADHHLQYADVAGDGGRAALRLQVTDIGPDGLRPHPPGRPLVGIEQPVPLQIGKESAPGADRRAPCGGAPEGGLAVLVEEGAAARRAGPCVPVQRRPLPRLKRHRPSGGRGRNARGAVVHHRLPRRRGRAGGGMTPSSRRRMTCVS